MSGTLSYRQTTPEDEDLLRAMRKSCGWGEDRIPRILAATEIVTWIFSLPSEDPTAPTRPLGMCSLETKEVEHGGDLSLCDPEAGTVMLTSLFVYKEFEGKGYGNQIMDLMEGPIARSLGAQTVTLTVFPFTDLEKEIDSKPLVWYRRRGYVEFRPRQNWYKWNGADLVGAFMSKPVFNR